MSRNIDSLNVAKVADRHPHGSYVKYKAGCRCRDCTAANRAYVKLREIAKLEHGDFNGLVDARAAREHLKKLAKAGVGKRAVHAASGVALTVIFDIRSGTKRRIRARTERKLLAVGREHRALGAIVPGERTHKLVAELLEEGYTEPFLARQLGYASPVLQFKYKHHVVKETELDVERLHRRLTT